MGKLILLRGARQLLTLRGPSGPRRGLALRNLGLIQDGSVLIADGLIRDVGPTRRIENLAGARDAEEINASGRVVLPGFVDSHTHLVSGPPRLLEYEMRLAGATSRQIAEAGGGPLAAAKAIHNLSPRTLRAQAIRGIAEALRYGTTTIEAKSGVGLTQAGEIKILRVQSALQGAPITLVSTFMSGRMLPAENTGEHIEWLCSHMLPLVRRRKLAESVDIHCEDGMFTPDQACRFLTAAKQLGFKLKMHTGEHANVGGVRLAVQFGAASVDHLVFVNEEDAALLSQSQTIATLLPGSVFGLGTQRYAPARMLIDRGAAVALASNYNLVTSPSQNLQMMIALACRKMNMTPAEAISAATINAAHALQRAHRVGSIEPGKSADLLVLGVSDYREIPYHFGMNLVDITMQRGRVVCQRSEVKWPVN